MKKPPHEADFEPLNPLDAASRADYLLGDIGEAMESNDGDLASAGGELDALHRISREIVSTLNVRELPEKILDLCMAFSQAERGILFYFEQQTGATQVRVVRGLDPEEVVAAEVFSRSILDEARNRNLVVTDDARSDSRFKSSESVNLQQIRSVLSVPIADESRVFGALYLDNRNSGNRFAPRVVRFVEILADLSAIAFRNAETFAEMTETQNTLSSRLSHFTRFDEIIGRSRPMVDLLKTLEKVAQTEFPVLLLGESGTGKELVTRAIHRASSRAAGPFVAQNCAAIPAELLESEFFGHTRGAFTGAAGARDGLIRQAHGGTLFLDEIADLDIRLQSKLLRVLEEGRVRPLGSQQDFAVNFRLISATSIDLQSAVKSGRLRRDLYYRLNVVTLFIPPLRERVSDLELLIQYFVEKHRAGAGGKELRFSREALRYLQKLPWRGNVRELEHFVKRALILSPRPLVELDDLPRFLDQDLQEDIRVQLPVGQMTLQEMEEGAIREALRRTGGNKAQAAVMLGIHRNALLRRIEKLELGNDLE